MSYQDLNLCRKFNLADLSEEKNFDEIKNLHIALCKFSKTLERMILRNVRVKEKTSHYKQLSLIATGLFFLRLKRVGQKLTCFRKSLS